MTNFRRLALLGLTLVVIAAVAWICFFRTHVPSQSGPMLQGAYVWQREWGPPLNNALKESAKRFDRIYILACEVQPLSGGAKIVTPDINYTLLAKLRQPVVLVIRVGVYRGPFDAKSPISRKLLAVVKNALQAARNSGLAPAEIQIDFDCPESKLDGYAKWLKMLAGAKLGVRLSFTSLPSWLDNHDFKTLANAADEFVLQIHSFRIPTLGDCSILCGRSQAERWIWDAARAGRPFRVALPTYSYMVAFDRKGKFIGLSADGPQMKWPQTAKVRRVDSPADELASLVVAWKKRRPANMTGLIWFRLPVSTDSLNFTQTTLNEIMKGRTPAPKIVAVVIAVKTKPVSTDGMVCYDISLKNAGTLRAEIPQKVILTWRGGRHCLVADGLNGYTITSRAAGRLEFSRKVSAGDFIQPGSVMKAGWLRLPPKMEIKYEIVENAKK